MQNRTDILGANAQITWMANPIKIIFVDSSNTNAVIFVFKNGETKSVPIKELQVNDSYEDLTVLYYELTVIRFESFGRKLWNRKNG